jgi:hypothetical protein
MSYWPDTTAGSSGGALWGWPSLVALNTFPPRIGRSNIMHNQKRKQPHPNSEFLTVGSSTPPPAPWNPQYHVTTSPVSIPTFHVCGLKAKKQGQSQALDENIRERKPMRGSRAYNAKPYRNRHADRALPFKRCTSYRHSASCLLLIAKLGPDRQRASPSPRGLNFFVSTFPFGDEGLCCSPPFLRFLGFDGETEHKANSKRRVEQARKLSCLR